MDEMLIKDGYPYVEGIPEIVESITSPAPYYMMAVKDGGYPYYYTVPDAIEDAFDPMPFYFVIVKDNQYPSCNSVPDAIYNVSEPLPYYFFAQSDDYNDGYPYVIRQGLLDDVTEPKPYYLGEDAEVTLMHNKIIICDYIQRIKTDFEYVSKVIVDDW